MYCVKCPQYSIRLEALGYLCTSCLLPAFDDAYVTCLRLSDVSVLDKRPLTVKLSNFCFEIFHRDIDRRVVFKFRKFWLTRNR